MNKRFVTDVRVRYAETDQMGVVYHSNYFTYFEAGRNEYFRSIGLPYKNFEEQGIFFPVLSCQCTFRKGAHYDDLLQIITFIKEVKGVRITIGYEVWREKVLLAEGETVHAFIQKGGGPLNMAKKFPQIWQKLLELCES